jgi:uncharacterized phage protein (TIGR01671 family)
MREILFRGKRKDNGEWATATSIFKIAYADEFHFYINSLSDAAVYFNCDGNITRTETELDCEWLEVIQETVSQFTGLTDKNGTEIFEGDILKFHKFKGEPDWLGFVRYDISMFVIKGEQPVDNGGFEVQLCSIDRKRCEIIGNIYDNSELLKEGDS